MAARRRPLEVCPLPPFCAIVAKCASCAVCLGQITSRRKKKRVTTTSFVQSNRTVTDVFDSKPLSANVVLTSSKLTRFAAAIHSKAWPAGCSCCSTNVRSTTVRSCLLNRRISRSPLGSRSCSVIASGSAGSGSAGRSTLVASAADVWSAIDNASAIAKSGSCAVVPTRQT